MLAVEKIRQLEGYEVEEVFYEENAIYHVTIIKDGTIIFSDAISYCKKRDRKNIAKQQMNERITNKFKYLLT